MSMKFTPLALAAVAAVISSLAATPSHAAGAHTAAGNIAGNGPATPPVGAGGFVVQQGGGTTAGPRTGSDRIDLSVCDLATFDFDKCLN